STRLTYYISHTRTTYPLSLHAALPIYFGKPRRDVAGPLQCGDGAAWLAFLQVLEPEAGPVVRIRCTARLEPARHHLRFESVLLEDRKSTRLNSSHSQSSYAVFCLKKKK